MRLLGCCVLLFFSSWIRQWCRRSVHKLSTYNDQHLTHKRAGHTSAPKFQKAIGHNDVRVYQKSYMTNNVPIDVQNILKGLSEDRKRLNFTRSIGFTRDLDMPKPHGSFLDKRHENSPNQKIIEDLRARFPKNQEKEIMKKARRVQWNEDKRKHLNSDYMADIEDVDATSVVPSRAACLSRDTFAHMLKYNVLQAAIIKGLWSTEPGTLEACVQPLLPLTDPKQYRAWYPLPITQPTASLACPFCGIGLISLKNPSLHLLECHCIAKDVSFCFGCAKTSDTTPTHLESVAFAQCKSCAASELRNPSCKMITWRGLIIKPARCPFCEDVDKNWSRDANLYQRHILQHLRKIHRWRYRCPDSHCKRDDEPGSMAALQLHLDKIHGIKLAPFVRQNIHCLGNTYDSHSEVEDYNDDIDDSHDNFDALHDESVASGNDTDNSHANVEMNTADQLS